MSTDWKLRLLTSVDLVNSTAYKTSHDITDAHEWVLAFQGFYDDFPNKYSDICSQKSKELGLVAPSPKFWKTIGDEILFAAEGALFHDRGLGG